MTGQEEEVVMALAVDDSCQWLLAGNTAGYLHLFNIKHYCTHHQTYVRLILLPRLTTITCGKLQEDEKMKAELSWQAHSSEILSVVWAGSGLVISASADHSLRMWTTNGQCVGCFGQPQSWTSAPPDSKNLSSQTVPDSGRPQCL